MKFTRLFALLSLCLLAGVLAAPAAASNKGEDSEPAASGAVEPGAEPAPIEADEPGPAEPAAEAPEAAEADPAETDSVEPAAPEPGGETDSPPAVERPELPAIDEDAELHTVRDAAEKADPKETGVSEATLALLRTLETRHASVVTVRGEFDQLKVSDIFLEEIASKGTFWYQKPDLFRCDYQPPDEMTNLIREDAIYVYVPELEQCEIYRFASNQERDQQLHSMVLGFGFKTAELLEAYEIRSSEDPGELRDSLKQGEAPGEKRALLEMKPRAALADTSPFTVLKLWIDKGSLLPEKVWFEDYNGDQTTLEIRSIDLNVTIEPERFAPSFPAGTEYIDKTES